MRWRGPGLPVDQLDRARGAATARLHARGPTEWRAAYREAVPAACRRTRARTVPALARGGRSGPPVVRPPLHVPAAPSLDAGPAALPAQYPAAECLLRRRR